MRLFVSGGCKNGKSAFAQEFAKRQQVPGAPLYYIATMIPADDEDHLRIARHCAERDGMGFETIELPRAAERLAELCDPRGSVLFDSATALLVNEFYRADWSVDEGAAQRAADGLVAAIRALPNIVIVSDAIYSAAQLYPAETELYRRSLAFVDRACAAACDAVVEFCFGFPVLRKGEIYASQIL